MSDAIVADGLVKRYGDVVALDEMSLSVPTGTVFGLLGPNGAGKTTTVRILTTLVRPDAGHATVAGFDVVGDARRLRSHIGVSGQYAAVDEDLTGMENLEMVGRLHHLGPRRSRARARELLARFDLGAAADSREHLHRHHPARPPRSRSSPSGTPSRPSPRQPANCSATSTPPRRLPPPGRSSTRS